MQNYSCDSCEVKQIDVNACGRTLTSGDLDVAMLQTGRRSEVGDGRREALLECAAQEFNAYGVGGASLARIARNWGATRPALYYYVRDREELATLCYGRTCEVVAADLAHAAGLAAPALDKLLAFVERSLDADRVPTAVLTEIAHLEGKAHGAIAAAHGANVESLRSLIRAGVADGSIRACDDEVIAQVVIGILFWIPLSVGWVEGTEPSYRRRTVAALIDMLREGQAANPCFTFTSPVDIRTFFTPAGRAFDRKAAAAAKVEELMMTASRMFNQRGIDGTSLDDITHALGATKGALYHYFRDKTDLVVKCTRRAFTLYERFTEAARELAVDPLTRASVGLYLNVQAQTSGLAPLVQLAGVGALPTAARREITRRARGIQQWYDANAQEGRAAGLYRDIDSYALAQLGAGSFEWLPKWLTSGDPRREHAIADEIVALFNCGLKAR
jgi:AcrR family transcriptional regulator